MKRSLPIIMCLGLLGAAAAMTPLGTAIGNWVSMADRNGYFVPEESSVWQFRETVSDTGSGGYWLYAEDDVAFFAGDAIGGYSDYSRITRLDAAVVEGFDPTDWRTWRHYSQVPCGDLLARYAALPEGLEFLSCTRGEPPQTVVQARYRVAGRRAAAVEAALVAQYGMGPLVWACCGYESRGYGGFELGDLIQLDPDLAAIISMSGAAEDTQQMPVGAYGLIGYFYVVVEIVRV